MSLCAVLLCKGLCMSLCLSLVACIAVTGMVFMLGKHCHFTVCPCPASKKCPDSVTRLKIVDNVVLKTYNVTIPPPWLLKVTPFCESCVFLWLMLPVTCLAMPMKGSANNVPCVRVTHYTLYTTILLKVFHTHFLTHLVVRH